MQRCMTGWFSALSWSVTSPVTAMFAGCRLVPLTHSAGVEIVQLRTLLSKPTPACKRHMAGWPEYDPVLSVMVRMPYRVDSNLDPQVTWLPTLTFMNIWLALFHTAVHLLAYGWGNCFPKWLLKVTYVCIRLSIEMGVTDAPSRVAV